MIDRYLAIQIIVFFASIVTFTYFERKNPAIGINVKKDIFLNIAAMSVVVFLGEYAKKIVAFGYDGISLSNLLFNNPLSGLPGGLKVVITIVMTDFCLYWVHRTMHGPWNFFWNTHAFHHTIKELWWLSGSRTSFLHLLLFAIPQVFIGFYLLQLTPVQSTVCLSLSAFINLWLHTNLWLNIGWFERFIITPNYHRLHHGAQGNIHKNMGFILTIWDRLFGTYSNPALLKKDLELYPVPIDGVKVLRMIIGL